jgi:putative two-component system response regulator
MPVLDGFSACRQLKQDESTRLIPIILMTGAGEIEDRVCAFEAGADDLITKPINAHELRARVRSLIRIKRYTDDLDSAEAIVLSLAMTVKARDAYTEGHCQRLATYAVALGRHLHLPVEDLAALERGGFLHDIGKIGIPDSILMKSGALSLDEYQVMKTHTVIGDRLCAGLRALQRVRPIIRHHHERQDGTGYPDGLQGDDVPLLAQITGIVDVFDALTSDRPYRRAASREAALDALEEEARKGWRRPDLVRAFAEAATSGEISCPPLGEP